MVLIWIEGFAALIRLVIDYKAYWRAHKIQISFQSLVNDQAKTRFTRDRLANGYAKLLYHHQTLGRVNVEENAKIILANADFWTSLKTSIRTMTTFVCVIIFFYHVNRYVYWFTNEWEDFKRFVNRRYARQSSEVSVMNL